MTEKREVLRLQSQAESVAAGPKPQVVGGTKWPAEGARVARAGDRVDVHYKVLNLGKRS